ncbi:MAG TPA: hypothetical protein VGM54_19730 [Chthoniobacter sp.]|jgi:hypothetical protein
MKASPSGTVFNFSTPEDSGFPYVLFLCVLGSFLAHAATFFLFQVVYPQRVTIPQPAPRVSLLTPSSPENIALLRWIDAEDPALVGNDNPVAPPGLVDVHYRPSFASPRTAPLGAPAEQARGVRFPPAVDHLSVANRLAAGSEIPGKLPVLSTSITYSGALAGRPVEKNPPVAFKYHPTEPADTTTALLGVTSKGEVRFAVLQQSSGDPALDELALAHLKQVTFAPIEAPLTWGFATYTWGTDAYATASTTP